MILPHSKEEEDRVRSLLKSHNLLTAATAATVTASAAIITVGDAEVFVMFRGGTFVVLVVGEISWATAMTRHV